MGLLKIPLGTSMAKFLLCCEDHSLVTHHHCSGMVRKSLSIPFDGVSTDIYWGIMDCIFESDYPHAWVFG